MKKLTLFTPPKNSQYNVLSHKLYGNLKKTACITSLAVCLVLTACSTTSANSEQEVRNENTISQISAFNDYAWGTSYEEIKSSEITDDMKELIDYEEEIAENDMVALSIKNQEVSGYSTSAGYIFSNEKLVAGSYDMGGITEESYEDLYKKFISKYGDSFIEKESTGWGRLSVWVDDSKNILCLSEILNVLYIENESPFLDFINEQFIEFHETDLQSSISEEGL